MSNQLPRVGDAVTFFPSCFTETADEQYGARLRGKIIYVNEAHRYYTAEALCWGRTIRESFNFQEGT